VFFFICASLLRKCSVIVEEQILDSKRTAPTASAIDRPAHPRPRLGGGRQQGWRWRGRTSRGPRGRHGRIVTTWGVYRLRRGVGTRPPSLPQGRPITVTFP